MSKVLFRCDGSLTIGMGHVARCVSLAEALRRRGVDVCFAMRALTGEATAFPRDAGFRVHSFACDGGEGHELGGMDLEATCSYARSLGIRWILVDHYGASAQYFAALRSQGFRVAVLDDMADRDLRAARWILNQNLGAEKLPYQIESNCVRLFGPRYALLRPQFAEARAGVQEQRAGVCPHPRLLVTLGGGDTSHLSSEVIRSLEKIEFQMTIQCVLGGKQPTPARLRDAAEASKHDVTILRNVADMEILMQKAQLSVNAGGSTCWELCCLGVPMVILVTSPDQAMIAAELEQHGCARNIGKWENVNAPSDLVHAVEELIGHPQVRAQMSARGREVVDGYGSNRSAASLQELIED